MAVATLGLLILYAGDSRSNAQPVRTINNYESAASNWENRIYQQRVSQPLRWSYDDHPIAEPVLFGRVQPLVWGALILLSSVYFVLALTPETADGDDASECGSRRI